MFLWNCLLLIPMILAKDVEVQISKNYYARIHYTKRRNILYDIKAIDPSIPENPSEELDLSNRMLTMIHINAFNNVRHFKTLDLSNNPLTMIWENRFAKMTNLENLDLSNCNISLIIKRFKGLGNLKVLDLTYNRITNLPKSAFIGLNKSCVIWLRGNDISSMSTKLYEVGSTSVNPFQVNQKKPFELKRKITICFNDTKLISVEKYTESEKLPSGCSPDDKSYSDGILNLSGMNIAEFQKGWYKLGDLAVYEIDLSVNVISRLTSEMLNDLPESISSVDLSNNDMELLEKDIIVNKHLRKINFKYNLIANIDDDVFVNTNLTNLMLPNNNLRDTKFVATLPPTITKISLKYNDIAQISRKTFDCLPALEFLDLSSNLITNLDLGVFADLQNIKGILLNRNKIGNLERNCSTILPDSLEVLNLSRNKLTHLTACTFVNSPKYELLLNSNSILNIEYGTFVSLSDLQNLDLSSNPLSLMTSGMLQGLTNLRNLRLEYSITKIEEDTFKNFKNLCKLARPVGPIKQLENETLKPLVPTEGCDVVVVDLPIAMIHEGVVYTS